MTILSKDQQQASPAKRALSSLATVLEYPGPDFEKSLEELHSSLLTVLPAAAEALNNFKEQTEKLTLSDLEELYTRTFDLAPQCIPYLSSHIYGDENFERGALMSRLSERYQETDFDTGGELPDHIALVLRFTPNFENDEFQELVHFCLSSAMAKMTESLVEAENPYRFVFKAASELIESEREGLSL